MYELFYNFTAEPFRLSPDHRFCFEHNSYGKARAYLAYAFKRAEGFVMITGRPGTGKTTLIGELVESLSTDKVVTANLVCTQLQADDLLKTVAYSFGVSPSQAGQAGKAELLQHLSTLLHSWHREGRRALLVVDEAQDLSPSAMEELRLLTNIQFGGQPLLQIFLLGQPELRDLILSREMEQVHQRIVAASHIDGLEADETEAYVIHRLSRVGWQGDPAIDRAIFPLIHRFSEGVPRRINLICSRLFLLGSVEERHTIEVKDVSTVIGELQAENLAAGTGISPADFRNSAKPDWVPVPGMEEAQAPEVEEAAAAPVAAVDDKPAEPLAEVKKKDVPAVESVVEPDPGRDAEISSPSPEHTDPVAENLPEAEAEAEAEADADADADGDGDADADGVDEPGLPSMAEEVCTDTAAAPACEIEMPAASEDEPDALRATGLAALPAEEAGPLQEAEAAPVPVFELLAESPSAPESASQVLAVATEEPAGLYDGEVSGVAGGEGVITPAPRRRLMLMLLLMGASVILFLLLRTCSAIPEGGTFPDVESSSPAEEGPGLAPAADSSSLARQELLPVFVEAGLRILVPVPVAVAAEMLTEATPVQSAEPVADDAGTGKFSGEVSRDAVTVEIAAREAWQETLLVSFAFDSDELAPESHPSLDKAAEVLRKNDAAVASIIGFTDEKGDSQYNLRLSKKRANAVKHYLIAAGIARERLHVEGRGILRDPVEGLASDPDDPMEPYRIVQITLGEG